MGSRSAMWPWAGAKAGRATYRRLEAQNHHQDRVLAKYMPVIREFLAESTADEVRWRSAIGVDHELKLGDDLTSYTAITPGFFIEASMCAPLVSLGAEYGGLAAYSDVW
jgi:hypothetical protein